MNASLELLHELGPADVAAHALRWPTRSSTGRPERDDVGW